MSAGVSSSRVAAPTTAADDTDRVNPAIVTAHPEPPTAPLRIEVEGPTPPSQPSQPPLPSLPSSPSGDIPSAAQPQPRGSPVIGNASGNGNGNGSKAIRTPSPSGSRVPVSPRNPTPRRTSSIPAPQPIPLNFDAIPEESYFALRTARSVPESPYEAADRLAYELASAPGSLGRALSDVSGNVALHTQVLEEQGRATTERVSQQVQLGQENLLRGLEQGQADLQRTVQSGLEGIQDRAEEQVDRVIDRTENVLHNVLSRGVSRIGAGIADGLLDHAIPRVLLNDPTRRQSTLDTGISAREIQKPLTVAMRLEPTLKTARRERERFAIKARLNGIALNVAIGMQVLLGALTTGLAAATRGRSTSIVVAIFGGASTCVATYLARARGTGEPENSKIRVRLLDHFIRDCDHIIFDEGYHVGKTDEDGEHIRDHYDDRLDELRRRLEEILGNNSDNSMPETEKRRQRNQQNV